MLGALEVTTGAWVYRLGRRCAADFIALPDQLLATFPSAPVIVVICDNDIIHHARKVTRYLGKHPRLELLYGARYSPHDNPAERIWGALKNYVANTAVTWPGRLRQIHSFFRARSPDQMLAAAAPWTSPWLPPGYEQNYWNAALVSHQMHQESPVPIRCRALCVFVPFRFAVTSARSPSKIHAVWLVKKIIELVCSGNVAQAGGYGSVASLSHLLSGPCRSWPPVRR